MVGRNVWGSIRWTDTVKSTTRHMSFKAVFGMVSRVKDDLKMKEIREKNIYTFSPSQVAPNVTPEKQ